MGDDIIGLQFRTMPSRRKVETVVDAVGEYVVGYKGRGGSGKREEQRLKQTIKTLL